jgi:hypothetical protein
LPVPTSSPIALRAALHHADLVADHEPTGELSAIATANAARAGSSELKMASVS